MFIRRMWRRFPNGWKRAWTPTSMTLTVGVSMNTHSTHLNTPLILSSLDYYTLKYYWLFWFPCGILFIKPTRRHEYQNENVCYSETLALELFLLCIVSLTSAHSPAQTHILSTSSLKYCKTRILSRLRSIPTPPRNISPVTKMYSYLFNCFIIFSKSLIFLHVDLKAFKLFSYCGTVITLCFCLDACVSECPLTLAVQLEESCDLIKVLRSGGAHLDFRTRDGITALHRAVLVRNSASLTVRTHIQKYFYFYSRTFWVFLFSPTLYFYSTALIVKL